MCLFVCERERERKGVCICVCVSELEREKESICMKERAASRGGSRIDGRGVLVQLGLRAQILDFRSSEIVSDAFFLTITDSPILLLLVK